MQLPFSEATEEEEFLKTTSMLVSSSYSCSAAKSGGHKGAEVNRGLWASLYDSSAANPLCNNNAGLCHRGELTVEGSHSSFKRTPPAITAISSIDYRDPAPSWLTFPLRSLVNDTAAARHIYHDGACMHGEANLQSLMYVYSDSKSGMPPTHPFDEGRLGEGNITEPFPQCASTSRPGLFSEVFHPTLQQGCLEPTVAEVSHGLVMPTDSSLFSSTRVMPSVGGQPMQPYSAHSILTDSSPAWRRSAGTHRGRVSRSPADKEGGRLGLDALKLAPSVPVSPTARRHGECSPTGIMHSVCSMSISGRHSSWVSTPTNISGVVQEDVAAAVAAGVGIGLPELPLDSFSSSMHTFIDHELEVATTDSPVFDPGSSLHVAAGSEDTLEMRGAWPSPPAKQFVHSNVSAPLLSSTGGIPRISRSASRRRRPPAMATSVTRPSQLPSEYAAAVRAASKYGRSLRQILRMDNDELDDASQES